MYGCEAEVCTNSLILALKSRSALELAKKTSWDWRKELVSAGSRALSSSVRRELKGGTVAWLASSAGKEL